MTQDSVEHINTAERLKAYLRMHPLEWGRILATAYQSFYCRFILGCTGKKTIVGHHSTFYNFSNIRIGNHALILDHVYMRAGESGSIKIGDHVAINSFAMLFGHGGIEIGDNAQIGPGVMITTTTHDFRHAMKTEFKKVTIGEWAWIGAGAIILPGTQVGKYSVIGAGSIVPRDVPDYTIVVGNPARPIGENEDAKKMKRK